MKESVIRYLIEPVPFITGIRNMPRQVHYIPRVFKLLSYVVVISILVVLLK